jgi:predicted Zn-dependent protease
MDGLKMTIPREVWLGFTSGVSDSERQAVEAGLQIALAVIAPVARPTTERIEGIEGRQRQCMRITSQPEPLGHLIDLGSFWQEVSSGLMHFALQRGRTLSECSAAAILVVDADLQTSQGWLFGATEAIDSSVQSVQLSVLSVARSRQLRTESERSSFLARLARHEFGHAIGLVPLDRRTHVVHKIGLHCTNVCSMRQGMSLGEFASLAQEEDSLGVVYCAECLEGLGIKDVSKKRMAVANPAS